MSEQAVETNIVSILQKIQTELVAPKGKRNTFGNYNYRNCEDVLEALKPLLAKYRCAVVIGDSLHQTGDRFYIKATATLHYEGQKISVDGFAREPLDRKGMDDSQITGATSSYARKYALNGLFAIDDNKDPDETNTHGVGKPVVGMPKETKKEVKKDPVKKEAAPASKPATALTAGAREALEKAKKAIGEKDFMSILTWSNFKSIDEVPNDTAAAELIKALKEFQKNSQKEKAAA